MTTSSEKTQLTKDNSKLSTNIAKEGIVLLQNKDNTLPIETNEGIALFGNGAYGSYRGGTGSGDVYGVKTVNIWNGLKTAGYKITSDSWLRDISAKYDKKTENDFFPRAFHLKDSELTKKMYLMQLEMLGFMLFHDLLVKVRI